MKKVVVKTTKEVFIIELRNIVRCESSLGYTYFYLNDNKKIISSKTLKEYEEIMPEATFIRVHQSHLINLNYVAHYSRNDGTVVLKNKDEIPVSFRKRSEFYEQFRQFSAAR